MNRRSLLAAATCAASFLGIVASGGAERSSAVQPVLPPYIAQLGSAVGLVTNAGWKDEASRKPALQIRSQYALGGSNDKPFSIWARTCLPGRQAATFTRRVILPGPPSPERPGVSGRPQLHLLGAEHWEVRFNGSPVYRGPGMDSPARAGRPVVLTRAQLAKLHRGENLIELRVVKPEVSCKAFGGVYFGLGAQFEADLYVTQTGSDVRVDEARRELGVIVTGHVTMGNRGPSEAPYARFHLTAGKASSQGEWRFVSGPEGALPGCEQTEDPANFIVDCEWTGFAPGSTGALGFHLSFTAAQPDWSEAEFVMSYSITADSDLLHGPVDPNDDHTRVIRYIICGPRSTSSECASAPTG